MTGRMAAPGTEDFMASLGSIAFTALIAAQFLSVVYAARYTTPVAVRAGR
jgi:hypothetical protein